MAPLEGILVADFTRVLAGPYSTMLLADLGAQVIKVERPGAGDDTRQWGPPWAADGQSTYFHAVNRNKSSVALDLADRDDLRLARRLARHADVVVSNFRPGTMARLGLDFAALSAANPGVICCEISGFGSGPGAALPGYDLLVQAMGGLMSITGEPGQPTKVGVAIVDVVTGLHATVGVLAALVERARTGRGQPIEVNLLSSLLSALVNQSSAYAAGDQVPTALGNAHPSIAPYEPFDTADRPMIIAVGNDRQFAALCGVLGLGALVGDERFADNPRRVAHRGELHDLLAVPLAGRGVDHWRQELTAAGVPCGPINDVAAAFALAGELGLAPTRVPDGPAVAGAGPAVPTVAHPIDLPLSPARHRSSSPTLGADDAEVRRWLDGLHAADGPAGT